MISCRMLMVTVIAWWSLVAIAQDEKLNSAISNIIIDLAESEESLSTEVLTEMLIDLAVMPVKINCGSEAEISRLFFLTPFQVQTLVNHVRTTGPVVSVLELASLTGFNRETAEIMLPFIDMTTDVEVGSAPKKTNLVSRLVATASAGLTNGVANTSPYPSRNNIRYRTTTGVLSAAFTAASDPGEKPVWRGYPDFISGGVSITARSRSLTFITGDFSARFGMGLIINSGYKPMLILSGTSYMGHNDGFTLSSSASQTNFLRGAALYASTGSKSISAFVSSRYRDARLKTDVNGEEYANILSAPPPHSTLSGQAASGMLRESSYGLSAGFGNGSFRYAITACLTDFSHNLIEGGSAPPLTGFSGKFSFSTGASYRMAIGRITGAGEAAISANGAMATAHTINIRFDDRFTANIIYRNYGRDYYAHLAGGPGRGSATTNEEGLMTRVTFEAARGLFINAGTDVYRFPWLRYNTSFPSTGFRGEVRAIYTGWNTITAEARLSGSESLMNAPGTTGIPTEKRIRQTTSKVTITLFPEDIISIYVNACYKQITGTGHGSLLSADISYTPHAIPIAIWFRHTMFSTCGFETGIYLYENDMLYGFSVPVHYGEGKRTALVLKLMAGRDSEIRLKYAVTVKDDSSVRTMQEDVKAQFIIRF